MIKIPGLTENQIINIIQKIATIHSHKSFGCYTSEDIEQEVWIIVLNTIDGFTFTRSKTTTVEAALEHWLNVVVSRRLNNFYRDKFVVPQKALKADKSGNDKQKRINLMHPIDVHNLSDDNNLTLNSLVDNEELLELVMRELNDELYDILDSIMSGETTNCYYKNKLLAAVKHILLNKDIK